MRLIVHSTSEQGFISSIFSPVTGDPVLTMRDTSGTDIITTEGLVWYFDEMFEWINVCDNGLGYIEAQVLCNSIGFPYFSYLESAKQ